MAVVRIEGSQHSHRSAVLDAGAQWLAQQHQLIARIAELDVSDEWAADGATSCAHWVSAALDVDLSTAWEWVRVGRALATLDEVDAAFAAGRCRTARRGHSLGSRLPKPRGSCWSWRNTYRRAARARIGGLADAAGDTGGNGIPAAGEDGVVVAQRRGRDGGDDGATPPGRMARVQAAVDGRVRGLEAGRVRGRSRRWPSLANQRADAFVELCRDGIGGVTTEVVLHVRGDGCSMDDGSPVSESAVARVAQSSFLRVLIHDAEGRPINASGRHRHPTTRQRRVVHERDRLVDCGATDLLEYDHDPPFEQSQRTIVDELRLRCAQCHHRRHRIDP